MRGRCERWLCCQLNRPAKYLCLSDGANMCPPEQPKKKLKWRTTSHQGTGNSQGRTLHALAVNSARQSFSCSTAHLRIIWPGEITQKKAFSKSEADICHKLCYSYWYTLFCFDWKMASFLGHCKKMLASWFDLTQWGNVEISHWNNIETSVSARWRGFPELLHLIIEKAFRCVCTEAGEWM